MVTLILLAIALLFVIANALGKLPLWPAVLTILVILLVGAKL